MNRNLIRHCLQIARDRLHNHPHYDRGFIHFSFLIVNNNVLEIGVNRRADVPIHYGYEEYSNLHSEVDAYRKSRGLIGNDSFEIFNVRLNKSGELRNSKPCPNCAYLLNQLGCERFFYTTDSQEVRK